MELTAQAPPKVGYPVNPTTFGERLKKARLDANLLQVELAQELGVYRLTIDKWECNVTKPRAKNKQKIIQFLGSELIPKTI